MKLKIKAFNNKSSGMNNNKIKSKNLIDEE